MPSPTALFLLPGASRNDAAVDAWLALQDGELGIIAREWFARLRACGDDVFETMHDGQATACLGEAAFAYVAMYKAHVNVGFFVGAELSDPAGLLEGSGVRMRHVKLRPGGVIDREALGALSDGAYSLVKSRVEAERQRSEPWQAAP